MICNLRRVSEARLHALLAEPSTITDFLYDEEGSPEAGDDAAFADLDIDKAWHALHFLMTGSAWDSSGSRGFLVAGGREIGDEDVGYGPARAFTNVEVRAIAAELEGFNPAKLRAAYDAPAMNAAEIYPGEWPGDPEDAHFTDYFVDYFEQLKAFIAGAAKEGEALIVYLN
jgi:hypothetical protein